MKAKFGPGGLGSSSSSSGSRNGHGGGRVPMQGIGSNGGSDSQTGGDTALGIDLSSVATGIGNTLTGLSASVKVNYRHKTS